MAEIVRFNRIRTAGGPAGSTTAYENLIARDTSLSPTLGTSMWESCPLLALRQDPSVGTILEQNFLGVTPATNAIPGWTTTTATSGAVTLDAVKGLKIDAGAVTAGQGVNIQLTSTPFTVAAGKPVWMEASVRFESLTSLKIQFLFGLAAIQTALITSNAVGTDDKIAFDGVTTAGTIVGDVTASTTSGTTTGLTLVNTTSYKLGIYAQTTGVIFYVNGAQVGSTVTANIPTAALSPSFVVQANATVQPLVYVRRLMVVGIN
jgi:hypothetical protein